MTWTNWAENQTCAARVVTPASEEEVVAEVRRALAEGSGVRAAGAGHSFTPVVTTDGTILDTDGLRGILDVDAARRLVTALPGTTVAEFGDPLWAAGLALANQGDIDTQAIAGAIATGTHGSGNALPSFSATMRACRLVDGHGEVVEIDESRPDLLRAAQVAIGMLGVMTSVTIEVCPAYRLSERIEHRPFGDVLADWDALFAGHRHFSFFWLPSEASAELYGLATPPGQRMTDTCYVKVYDEAGDDLPDDPTPGRRVDRSYRIYPGEFDTNFHELEYFVPLERGREAVEAMRELMLASQPDADLPARGADRRRRRRAPLLQLPAARPPSSRSRACPARTTGPTCARSTACSASSARACTGASCTSSRASNSPSAIPRARPSSRCAASSIRKASSSNDHLRPLFE